MRSDQGAKIAATINSARKPAQPIDTGSRVSRRRAAPQYVRWTRTRASTASASTSASLHARIEKRLDQVDHEIHQNEEGRQDEHCAWSRGRSRVMIASCRR